MSYVEEQVAVYTCTFTYIALCYLPNHAQIMQSMTTPGSTNEATSETRAMIQHGK